MPKYLKLFEDWDAPEEWDAPNQEDLSTSGVRAPTPGNTWIITTSFTHERNRDHPLQFTGTNCMDHKATLLVKGEWYLNDKVHPIEDPVMGAFMKRLKGYGAQWIWVADTTDNWFDTTDWSEETNPQTLEKLEGLYQVWLDRPFPRESTHDQKPQNQSQ